MNTDLWLIMGVSGSGKSTIGTLLAERLGLGFWDADDFHPPENVAKMSQGIPLTDEDRWPWLANIREEMTRQATQGGVFACSALKAAYRKVLETGPGKVRIVFLQGSPELLTARMKSRSNHFMPASLLESQLATLEVPVMALTVDVGETPEKIVEDILTKSHWISAR